MKWALWLAPTYCLERFFQTPGTQGKCKQSPVYSLAWDGTGRLERARQLEFTGWRYQKRESRVERELLSSSEGPRKYSADNRWVHACEETSKAGRELSRAFGGTVLGQRAGPGIVPIPTSQTGGPQNAQGVVERSTQKGFAPVVGNSWPESERSLGS